MTPNEKVAHLALMLVEMVAERDRYKDALTIIAAYHDETATGILEATGNYNSFDEPNSVRIARRALKR